MHCCEFCGSEFLARPQVKCPRACNNCQVKRQRANERAWHARHLHFDDQYHHRPYLINGGVKSPYLFPSRRGRVLTHAAMLYAMNRIKETLRVNDFSFVKTFVASAKKRKNSEFFLRSVPVKTGI